jgi:hypothetical protein
MASLAGARATVDLAVRTVQVLDPGLKFELAEVRAGAIRSYVLHYVGLSSGGSRLFSPGAAPLAAVIQQFGF